MQNIISGHNVATGEALQEHVRSRLTALDEQYQTRLTSTQTIFEHGARAGFRCSITARGPRMTFNAEGETKGTYAHLAFDRALTKLEKQIRRYNRERNDVTHTRLEDTEVRKLG